MMKVRFYRNNDGYPSTKIVYALYKNCNLIYWIFWSGSLFSRMKNKELCAAVGCENIVFCHRDLRDHRDFRQDKKD
jgi:hypothetical protein